MTYNDRCPRCAQNYHGSAPCYTVGSFTVWPGPSTSDVMVPTTCPTCYHGYIGQHQCDPDVLDALAAQLHRKAAQLRGQPLDAPPAVTHSDSIRLTP